MKRLKSQKGFTLVEMLICVVILMLLAGICNAGTNIAMKSYNESLFESNSQMLESTMNMYLGDILRHATFKLESTPLANGNKKVETLTNDSYGIYGGKFSISSEGRLYLHKTDLDTSGSKLLNEKVYTKALKISNFRLEYNETERFVTGGYTIESTIISGLKKECSFTYKIVISD